MKCSWLSCTRKKNEKNEKRKKNALNHELSRLLWCVFAIGSVQKQTKRKKNRIKYRVQIKCYLKMVTLNLKQSQRPIIHFSLLLFYAIKWKDEMPTTTLCTAKWWKSLPSARDGRYGKNTSQMTRLRLEWNEWITKKKNRWHRPERCARARAPCTPIGQKCTCDEQDREIEEGERDKRQASRHIEMVQMMYHHLWRASPYPYGIKYVYLFNSP